MRLPQDQEISKFYYGHGEACDLIYHSPSQLISCKSPSQGARMHPPPAEELMAVSLWQQRESHFSLGLFNRLLMLQRMTPSTCEYELH